MSHHSSPDASLNRLRCALHLLGVSTTLAIVLVAGFEFYQPVHAEEVRVRRVTAATEEFLDQEAELKKDAENLKHRRQESEELLTKSMQRIPETAQKTEFLEQLSELASKTDLKIHEFRPGKQVERKSHSELSIHVSGEANYGTLCRFLAGLEKLDRLTRLNSLNVSGSYGGSDLYPVSMTVIIFFAPHPEDSQKTETENEPATR